MGIGITLKKLIDEQNTTVSDVSKATGVKKSTIYSIIDRNSKSANISDLYKIAHHLGVSLDYFYDGAVSDDFYLSVQEKEMVKAYRSHPEVQSSVNKLLDLPAVTSGGFDVAEDAAKTVNAISAAVTQSRCKKNTK